MYFDSRLWAFTRGVRLRIVWTVLVGLFAAAVGIARLVLFGWLLARVIAGDSVAALVWPAALTAAAIVLRGALEYFRTMVAHRTAARVQARCARRSSTRVIALGPAHFTQSRTGDVILSMVEGVQQLETYFGQYLPQLAVAALTPVLIFAFVAFVDLPIALVLLVAALVTLIAPAAWHSLDRMQSMARSKAYAAFGAEFLDSMQGLATLKAFGQSGSPRRAARRRRARRSSRAPWACSGRTRWRAASPIPASPSARRWRSAGARTACRPGEMELGALLIVLMLGVEVFRPLRELRVLLHQGMLGISAAQGIFSDPRRGARRRRPSRPPASIARGLAPTVAFEDVRFAYPGGRRPAHEGLSFRGRGGRARRHRGAERRRQVHRGPAPPALLRPAGRPRPRGRPRPARAALDQLRSLIAVVTQDTYLFHGTVEENIRLGKPDATHGGARGGGARRQRARVHRAPARRATRRSSASAACGSPAASASASPSPARSCATRRS